MPFWRLCTVALLFGQLLGSEPGNTVSQKTTWSYGIEWRLVRAGTARMTWSPETAGFLADLHIESAGLVSKLYRVSDDYKAQMNEQLCASAVGIHAEEGKRRRDTEITFANGKASYAERDLLKNNAIVLAKETPIPACVYEYIGGLQRLRLQRPDVGQSIQVPMSDGKRTANVKVEAHLQITVLLVLDRSLLPPSISDCSTIYRKT